MKLSEIVAAFQAHPPTGCVLDQTQVTRTLKRAVRFHCGFAKIKSDTSEDRHTPIDADADITGDKDLDLNPSEWALIKRLFDLYIEQENATALEASRQLGLEVYGRTVSEIVPDVVLLENEYPRWAFMEPAVTI